MNRLYTLAALQKDAETITCMLEIGDQRLLASDGPAGGRLPELSPDEWGQVYRACLRVKERAHQLLECPEAKDSARLDEIERTKCYPFWNGVEWVYIVAAERSSKIERRGTGSTVREAIDAGTQQRP